MAYILMAINIVLMSIGQLFFKQASIHFSNHSDLHPVLRYAYNPWFYAAIAFFAVSTFLWIKILTMVKLSVAYPLLSISYILIIIGAYFLFGEKVSFVNIAGIFLIMLGVSLVTLK
ncbi:EamA family transporter [Patescibacteria group bacterium]|nr:EamA family transporter [Patescibacteria group bacterium]